LGLEFLLHFTDAYYGPIVLDSSHKLPTSCCVIC